MECVDFFEKHKREKTELKVFLTGGAMLSGKIVAFYSDSIILNKCLIFKEKIISITPI
ncbi:hypothetical protein GW796_05960 [archaeon]|nr:hypothetical protein [archaeon]NCQ51429.1 hypothetical protein [archaeon]NCT58745.1 hypothetical protein [archaeon]